MQSAEFIHSFYVNATIALTGIAFILAFLLYVVGQLIRVTICEYLEERRCRATDAASPANTPSKTPARSVCRTSIGRAPAA